MNDTNGTEKDRYKIPLWLEIAMVIGILFAAWQVRMLAAERTAFDSDEAIQGLMAKHIAERQNFPLMEYGSAHHGAAGSYFIALIFKLTGKITVPILRLYGITVWLLAAVPLFIIARSYWGRAAAFFAVSFFGFPSIDVLQGSVKAYPGQAETQLAIGLILYWTQIDPQNRRFGKCLDFFAGCIMGIITWLTPAALVGSVCIFGYQLYRRYPYKNKTDLITTAGFPVLGFFIGFLPVLIYHVLHHTWHLLTFLTQSPPTIHTFPEIVWTLLALNLPRMLGFHPESTFTHFGCGIILWILLATLGIQLGKRENRRPLNNSFRTFLLIYISIYILVLLIPRWNQTLEISPRYLFPILPPLSLLLGSLISWKRGQWIAPKCALAGIFWLWLTMPYPAVLQMDALAPDCELVKQLEQRGITDLLADYWTAYKVVFLSEERIIASPQGGPIVVDRYPAYTDRVYAASAPAYLLYTQHWGEKSPAERLKSYLNEKKNTYTNEEINGLSLFWKIQPKTLPGETPLQRFGDLR